MSIEVRRARDEAELAAVLALRDDVFVREQGVDPAADRDGRDGEAIQLVAVDDGSGVLGTCRVLIDAGGARSGRLCVSPAARRRGIGAALLAEAEREARAAGAALLSLHAQTSALGLYEQVGYAACGPPFTEEGIEHLRMEKRLD